MQAGIFVVLIPTFQIIFIRGGQIDNESRYYLLKIKFYLIHITKKNYKVNDTTAQLNILWTEK